MINRNVLQFVPRQVQKQLGTAVATYQSKPAVPGYSLGELYRDSLDAFGSAMPENLDQYVNILTDMFSDGTLSETQVVDEKEGSSKKIDMSTSFYKGPFKKVKTNVTTEEDIFNKLGFYAVKEQFGKVTGSDSVYIGSSTFDINQVALTVSVAIFRKLFAISGRTFTDSTIYVADSLTPGHNVILFGNDAEGNVTKTDYVLLGNETLGTLAYNSGLYNQIIDYAKGSTTFICSRIELRANTVFLANLDLKNEQVVMKMTSKLTIQNRTKGATGTGDSTDVVDNQPVKGYLYYFKKGNPRTKNQGDLVNTTRWREFNHQNNGGVILVSSGEANVDNTMKEPPSPHFFQNCSKSSYVRLEPGNIKTCSVSNMVVKYYEDFLRSIAWFNGSDTWRNQRVGDTQLLGLEETLNTASTNLIHISYEAENRTGCFIKTGRLPIMKKHFEIVGPVEVSPS